MDQVSSSRSFARPRVSVAIDDTPPLAMPSPGRMIDTLTPKTRRVSKLPQAEVTTPSQRIEQDGHCFEGSTTCTVLCMAPVFHKLRIQSTRHLCCFACSAAMRWRWPADAWSMPTRLERDQHLRMQPISEQMGESITIHGSLGPTPSCLLLIACTAAN